MRRRSFSLFALVLVSAISCAQSNGVAGDPMEAEAIAPGDQAEALAVEEATEPFADMDMSIEAVLAMDTSETEEALVDGNPPPVVEPSNETAIEPAAAATAAAAPAKKAKAKAKNPKTAFPKAESVPVVVRDPMKPGPEEEMVPAPSEAPEDTLGAIDEVVAVNDPEPIQSPFDEEVAMENANLESEPMQASTGIGGFLSQHPWAALLGLIALLGGSILLYWGRNRHQS